MHGYVTDITALEQSDNMPVADWLFRNKVDVFEPSSKDNLFLYSADLSLTQHDWICWSDLETPGFDARTRKVSEG